MKNTIVSIPLMIVLAVGAVSLVAPRSAQAHECGWNPYYGNYAYAQPREGFSFSAGKFRFSLWGDDGCYYRPYPRYVVVPAPVYAAYPRVCHETVIVDGRPCYIY